MMQSLPLLVMAIIMAAALGPSLRNTIFAIAIPLVPYVARVIRANTLSLREQPFVEAAKEIGMAETRIVIRHVLPNTLAPLIVLATAQIGSVILIEAGRLRGADAPRTQRRDGARGRGAQAYLFTRLGVAKAVDDVSFAVRRGETLAIVGESGCGKTMTALSLLCLVPNPPGRIVGGSIKLDGKNLVTLSAP